MQQLCFDPSKKKYLLELHDINSPETAFFINLMTSRYHEMLTVYPIDKGEKIKSLKHFQELCNKEVNFEKDDTELFSNEIEVASKESKTPKTIKSVDNINVQTEGEGEDETNESEPDESEKIESFKKSRKKSDLECFRFLQLFRSSLCCNC